MKNGLIRQYMETNDPTILRQIQEINAKDGFSISDIDYLNGYILICNEVIDGAISNSTALDKLHQLNEDFKFDICPHSYKDRMIERSQDSPDWYNSNCY